MFLDLVSIHNILKKTYKNKQSEMALTWPHWKSNGRRCLLRLICNRPQSDGKFLLQTVSECSFYRLIGGGKMRDQGWSVTKKKIGFVLAEAPSHGFNYSFPAFALWSGTNKKRDVSTGPLARLFAHSLAPLTCSLAPDCSLRSRPPLRSLVRSLAQE